MNIPDQVDRHFDVIFLVWFAAFVAASLTSVSVKGHRLRHVCSGIAVAVLAAPVLYLAGLLLWVLVVRITR